MGRAARINAQIKKQQELQPKVVEEVAEKEWKFEKVEYRKWIGRLVKELKEKGVWESLTQADKSLIEKSYNAYIFDGNEMLICFPCLYFSKLEYNCRVFIYVCEEDEPGRKPSGFGIPSPKDIEKINNEIWEMEGAGDPRHIYDDETVDGSAICLCLNQ